ncbi:MAG: hypothetical protein ACTSX6_08190 [Candidatus Heimdallarchaeaceae archaeon]
MPLELPGFRHGEAQKVDINKLYQQKTIDPHFSENKSFYSPIARFISTNEGWNMAIDFCKILSKGD